MDNHATLLSPPGRFAEVDGAKIHWQEWGASTSLPAILLECGLCMMSACWGWLAPALARHTRVLAWDRPGLGWSQELPGPRNAARIAGELLQFIPTVAANEPLVLLGHSMGALIARAALAQSPGRFPALIFLDASHPGQRTQPMTRRRMRNFFLLLEGANLLASRGLPVPTLPLASELEHLPEPERFRSLHFLKSAPHLRTAAREARAWEETCAAAASAPLRDVPLLVISAQKHALPGWNDFQNGLAAESSRSRHITFTDATHISLMARREHAERTAESILGWLQDL